ncbi:right-handed parallel beta-helix repeat-containing protein [Stackebrandtia soli]|uniref:right-handed parallel beta-helix repeat-containing protein n=1 Tax=Stackebrandtia soli TaxID=1892856 RepID=UPI0039EA7937
MRRRSRLAWMAAAVVTVLAVAGFGTTIATADSASVTVYLAVNGDDDADGSSGRPLKSLRGARDLLADIDSTSATIVVRPGTYYESATVNWAGVPQTTIALRRDGGTERPVFDGSRATGTARYWMDSHGGPSLDVREVLVRNYRTGGLRLDTDGNTVRNMIFEKLGNKYVGGGDGYAAVHLLGSSNNTITNNIFRKLENTDCPGCIHGVYAANGSSDSEITGNRFSDITGDVVRLRNGTVDNLVSDNTFSRSGSAATDRAFVSFWRFRSSETCGSGNRVEDNQYDGRYYNGTTGQRIAGSGAEPGLSRCVNAITESGNTRI